MDVESTSTKLSSLSISEKSSIFSIISNIKNKVPPKSMLDGNMLNDSVLHNHLFGVDNWFLVIYVEAEIRSDCLDQGSDPMEGAYSCAVYDGLPEDRPAHCIGKKLGGGGDGINIFPFNSEVGNSEWKKDEDKVYRFIKNGENRSARVFYGISYSEDEEKDEKFSRPDSIYYYFELYENGKNICETLEGKFINARLKK